MTWSWATDAPSGTSHPANVASVISMPSLGMRMSMVLTFPWGPGTDGLQAIHPHGTRPRSPERPRSPVHDQYGLAHHGAGLQGPVGDVIGELS